MSKLLVIKPAKLVKYLNELGFKCVRQKGSHKFFRHPDGRTTVVPFHRGEDIGRGLLSKILDDIEVSRNGFIKWMK